LLGIIGAGVRGSDALKESVIVAAASFLRANGSCSQFNYHYEHTYSYFFIYTFAVVALLEVTISNGMESFVATCCKELTSAVSSAVDGARDVCSHSASPCSSSKHTTKANDYE